MKKTFILALLAATALAPATAMAQNRHDRAQREHHQRADRPERPAQVRQRANIGRNDARVERRNRRVERQARRAERPRTVTPPASTAPRSNVTVRSAREARAGSATDRYNAARAQQRHDRERRNWDRNTRRDQQRAERRDHDRERRYRHDDRNDRYRQAERRYQRRVEQARNRYDFHDRARWNRNWRENHRYDWRDYRAQNRYAYRLPRYYAPRGYDYGYRRFSIGLTIGSMLYQDRYWINDPGYYRLPPAYGPYRWVRYYNDALLVDVRDGMVVDVIYDIFW
ncbi:RcnB family protein [Stakelama marina]|uniref:RcnB family protein n=1 Tax=Stakelama marina TaxID=2826939 RepID=A0A8T4IB73_9SPHN|nr:RcnB family protein [Stakelama marina]MBR0551663.1 RcnB family protein [Stakelama marina]